MSILPNLPKTTHLNRPIIFSVIGVLLFLLIFAIVHAFDPGGKRIATTAITANQNAATTVAPIFKDLPRGYNDTTSVQKYIHGDAEKNLAAVEQELGSLRAQYSSLQQQVVNSLQRQSQAPQHANSAEDNQARTSGLLFGGTAENLLSRGGVESTLPGVSPNQSTNSNQDPSLGAPVTEEQAAMLSRQRTEAQKWAVIKAADNPEDIYDLHNIVKPISPYEIQAGTIVPAVLITGINTTLSGVVVAQVKHDIYDTVSGKYLLIPKGSKALGEYDTRVAYGDQRVLITFNRIIRPDGSSILLGKPMAADYQGSSGVEGSVNNHWWRILGAATLSTILSVGVGVASDRSANTGTIYPSAKQNAILGGAAGIAQSGQSIVNRALDVRPTITLPPGYQFNIIVRKDMVLTPYQPN